MKIGLVSWILQKRNKIIKWMIICAMVFAVLAILKNPPIIPRPLESQFLEPEVTLEITSKNVHENYTNEGTFTTILLSDVEHTQSEMENRRKRLEDLCHTVQDRESSVRMTVSNMLVDEKHGISWCPIYKAGSSAWMEHFAVLAGILSEEIINLIREELLEMNTIVKEAFRTDIDPNRMLEKVKHTQNFLMVRHPFERLLSAYRDKLEHMKGREYYYKRYGRHIRQHYRKNKTSTDTKIEPTFVEFLKFIVAENYFDEHWAPYYKTCRPCAINYNYILKFETFRRDEDYLFKKLHLKELLYPRIGIRRINGRRVKTSSVVRKYFKDVPKWLLKKIHDIYEMDFKLFNYSPADYYFMSNE